MIRSFKSKALRQFAATGDGSKLSVPNRERVRQILLSLDQATSPEMMNLPGLRFHALKGRDKGRYAVTGESLFPGTAKTQSMLTWRIITDED